MTLQQAPSQMFDESARPSRHFGSLSPAGFRETGKVRNFVSKAHSGDPGS